MAEVRASVLSDHIGAWVLGKSEIQKVSYLGDQVLVQFKTGYREKMYRADELVELRD